MKRILVLTCFLGAALAGWAQSNAPVVGVGPLLDIDNRSYEFGKALQGDLIRHDFAVSNGGDQALHITDVHPSCGCTTAGAWPHDLAPGQSGVIPIQINSKNLSGTIKKTVTITSNDRHSPTVLTLMGQVTKSIDVTPPFAMFHLIMGGSNVAPSVVKIANRTENPLKITSVTSDSPAFKVGEVKTDEDGKSYEISVAANPPFLRGTNGTILVNTSWSNYVIRIPAYLTVQQAIMTQPHAITVPAKVDKTTTFKVTLYSVRPEDRFSDPVSTDDNITLSMTNSSANRPVYTLSATIPAGYHTAPGHPTTITVKTTDAQTPVVTIPVMQSVSFAAQQASAARIRQPLPAISSSALTVPPPPVGPAAH